MVSHRQQDPPVRSTWSDERLDDLRQGMHDGFNRVELQFQQVNGQFQRVDRQFEQVDRQFDQMNARMDTRFEQVDARLDRIDTRLDRMEERTDARFDHLDLKLDGFHDQLGTIQRTMITGLIVMVAALIGAIGTLTANTLGAF